MRIRQWAKDHGPVLAAIVALIIIGGFVWGVGKFVFAPPPLAVSVHTTPLRMPRYMYFQLDSVLAKDSATFSDSTALVLRQVRGFLRDTENFGQITLVNSSDVSLHNVDIRLKYVRDLDGWAIEGDALDVEERSRLADAVRYDGREGLVTVRDIPRLPPNSTLILYLWGDLSFTGILGLEPVSVTYDGGAGRVVREATVRGLDAFVYENATLLVLALLLMNVWFWQLIWWPRTAHGRSVAHGESVEPNATIDESGAAPR